jgi:MinD-like ATPase involved in chromosome partitioning or flagellar assembly
VTQPENSGAQRAHAGMDLSAVRLRPSPTGDTGARSRRSGGRAAAQPEPARNRPAPAPAPLPDDRRTGGRAVRREAAAPARPVAAPKATVRPHARVIVPEGGVAVLDRSGQLLPLVPDALDLLGLEDLVRDAGPATAFGPETTRADVVLLGPRELSPAGLRRIAKVVRRHPFTVVAALVEDGGPTVAELRAAGIAVRIRGPITLRRVATALDAAYTELDRLADDADLLRAEPPGADDTDDTDEAEAPATTAGAWADEDPAAAWPDDDEEPLDAADQLPAYGEPDGADDDEDGAPAPRASGPADADVIDIADYLPGEEATDDDADTYTYEAGDAADEFEDEFEDDTEDGYEAEEFEDDTEDDTGDELEADDEGDFEDELDAGDELEADEFDDEFEDLEASDDEAGDAPFDGPDADDYLPEGLPFSGSARAVGYLDDDEDGPFVAAGPAGDLGVAGARAPIVREATMLTVASATGGCGKTFFATNLAALCARSGSKVLLVDLDLQFGEVAAALRVRHPYSVYDGLYDAQGRPLPERELEEHLHELVFPHSLGFDVLTAPRDPALADYVGARDATRVLDAVSPRYDVIVVDTPPSLNEVVLTALDRSDVVVVLATLDVPSLKNLTVFLETLRRLHIDDSRLRLMLNKVEDDIGINVGQAQDAFDKRFVAEIPLARIVSKSINAGTVVVELEPRGAVSRAVGRAAANILPPELVQVASPQDAAEPRKGRLRRMFRRPDGSVG